MKLIIEVDEKYYEACKDAEWLSVGDTKGGAE